MRTGTSNNLIKFENSGISVVIGSYNRKGFLKKTIKTLRAELKSCPFPSEIIIVDGGSTDGTLSWLIKQKDIITIVQHNRGNWKGKPIERRSWGYFMNLGFKSAKGKYICMLSDDCLVIPGAIINGYSLFEETELFGKKVGGVAFYWRNGPEMNRYWICVTNTEKMLINHGIFLNQALKDVRYINEIDYFFYHADGDLCLNIWDAGYSIIPSPDSFIEHYSHANEIVRSSNMERQKQDYQVYKDTWFKDNCKDDNEKTGYWLYKNYSDKNQTALDNWNNIYIIDQKIKSIKKRLEYFIINAISIIKSNIPNKKTEE